jgi:hypothetical protein
MEPGDPQSNVTQEKHQTRPQCSLSEIPRQTESDACML